MWLLCTSKRSQSCSVMSDCLWLHGLSHVTPWNSPGQNTEVDSHSLLQGILQPRDWTQVFHIEGRFFTSWATREPSKGKADAKTFIKEHREQSKVKLIFTMDVLGWILALSSLWSWWSKTDVKEPWNMTPSPRVQPSLHTSTSDLPVTVPRGFVWILIFLALDACRNKLL